LFAGIHGFEPFADTLRAIGPLFEAPLSAVKVPFHLEAGPSVETLAAPYPDLVEARFGGPCVIAGYSIGCVIAYEVALGMIERGRLVPMLLLFDGFAPRRKRRKATRGRGYALIWSAFAGRRGRIGPAWWSAARWAD